MWKGCKLGFVKKAAAANHFSDTYMNSALNSGMSLIHSKDQNAPAETWRKSWTKDQ